MFDSMLIKMNWALDTSILEPFSDQPAWGPDFVTLIHGIKPAFRKFARLPRSVSYHILPREMIICMWLSEVYTDRGGFFTESNIESNLLKTVNNTLSGISKALCQVQPAGVSRVGNKFHIGIFLSRLVYHKIFLQDPLDTLYWYGYNTFR